MTKNRRVLFVTYGGGHARMLKPVIKNMLSTENVEIHILALNTAYLELADLPVRIWRFKDFFANDSKIIAYGKFCLASLEKVIDEAESICYLGANFKELVEKYGQESAEQLFREGGRYIFEPRNTLCKIVEAIAPDLLITTNSPRSEKMAVLAARDLGIPSAAFIDMFGIRCESWFRDSNFADLILVLSESVRRHYIDIGRDANQIIVTGNPSFDSLAQHFAIERERIGEWRKNSPYTILWASQPEPAYLAELDLYGDTKFPFKAEAELLKAFDFHPDWQLIARNHPSEQMRVYPDRVRISSQSDDIAELLSKVHVVLTPSSTIGFQGVIMGASLITIDRSVLTPTMPYAAMGYSYGVREFKQIGNALEHFSHAENRVVEPAYQETNAAGKALNAIMRLLG